LFLASIALVVSTTAGARAQTSEATTSTATSTEPPAVYVYTPPGYGTGVAQPTAPMMRTPQVQTVERSASIRGLWLPGLIALPISYVITWSVASATLSPGSDAVSYAFIPLVGPWLVLTGDANGGEAFYVAMGLIQDVAALCLILGLSIRQTWTETVFVADAEDPRSARISLAPRPYAGGMGAELTLTHF
jgi:hypothetical protein